MNTKKERQSACQPLWAVPRLPFLFMTW